ncbi:MAG: response regulator [Candidatus Calescibacterium sp.]|nr:response regulator [Candidatus Calescibacterium sp.]MDW8087490.1 response regulator [Candidatus Calescibacterium sp.]
MKILVADNNKTITRIIKTALDEEGYSVEVANSKEDALRLVNEIEDIDAVLIDTKFDSDKDGYYAAKQIKSMKNVHVVMLVNALEKPDLNLMEEIGATSYLTKPIDSRKLIQIISEIENSIKSQKSHEKVEQVKVEDINIENVKKKQKKSKKVETETREEIQLKEESLVEQDIQQAEQDTQQIDSSDEEKSVISYDWTLEQRDRITDELSLLLSSVREIFENIKSIEKEARDYVKEISAIIPELRNKVQNIPDPDKIVLQVVRQVSDEVQKKILNQIVEKIYSDIKEEMKNLLGKEFDRLKNSILSQAKENLIPYIEGEIMEKVLTKVRAVLFDKLYDSVYQSVKDEINPILDKFRRELREVWQSIDEITEENLARTKTMGEKLEREKYEDQRFVVEERKTHQPDLPVEDKPKEQFLEGNSDFISIEDL